MKYIEAITIHTKNELFKMGFYLIIGAFISACLQVLVSKGIFLQMNRVNSIAVLVMILAAFFISICSTSNAFIARSFYNIMPMNSLLAFMVMGPMLDVTNLSVMLGTFKRGFVFKLIRSEEHTSELQSRQYLVCRLLLEKKKNTIYTSTST